jgi:hypothetical protein
MDMTLSGFPALNLSFFENDSVDLLNLTSSLGANLLLDSCNSSHPGSPWTFSDCDRITTPALSDPSYSATSSSTLNDDTLSDPWPSSSSINRASDMLRSSLNFMDFPAPPERSNSLDDTKKSQHQLEEELASYKRKLANMEKSFNKIKVSQRGNVIHQFGRKKN